MRHRIRGGSGLGDAMYLRPLVEKLVAQGHDVTVCTFFPDVFTGLRVSVEPFNRDNITITAHYTHGKHKTNTDQWQDICASARMPLTDLRFNWDTVYPATVRRVRDAAGDRPVVLVIGGREPMGRRDSFGIELLPSQRAFQKAIDETEAFTVIVGKGPQAYKIRADLNLNDKTNVCELMDLAKHCDGIIGQCSYAIPLAEGFLKPLFLVWSRAGFSSAKPYIKTITPEKIVHRKTTTVNIIDNEPDEQFVVAAARFNQFLRVSEAVCAHHS